MTFTKEQLAKIIESADEVISACDGTNEDVHPESDDMLRLWDHLNDVAAPPQVVKRLAEIALASLESRADAEPVAYMIGGHYLMHAKDPKVDNYTSAVPLYTRPQPAPVVPQIIHSQGGTTVYADYYAIGWNACRAAMLQGGKS